MREYGETYCIYVPDSLIETITTIPIPNEAALTAAAMTLPKIKALTAALDRVEADKAAAVEAMRLACLAGAQKVVDDYTEQGGHKYARAAEYAVEHIQSLAAAIRAGLPAAEAPQ